MELPCVNFAEKDSNKTVIIVAVSVSVSVFVILVFVAVLLRRRKVKQKLDENVESINLSVSKIPCFLCVFY